jgi:DNA-binding NarL/FixJ family response regulator
MEKNKVLLSYPQVIFREGIHFILLDEEDFEVTGETTSNQDAIDLIVDKAPNIAILGMRDSLVDGSEATSYIKRIFPLVQVILIIDGDNQEQLFSAVKSGASACLTKDADPQYLVGVMRQIAQGSQPIIEALLIPELASNVLTEFEDSATLSKQYSNLMILLSPRETEILNLVTQGNGLTQIAPIQSTSQDAIKRELRLIVNKLVANNQARNIIEASKQNLTSTIIVDSRAGKLVTEYITGDEFRESKDTLMQRLKSFKGELAQHNYEASASK